jgi:3-hydroxyisobutyrate dehydrogenase-like beta-hydroxyacid dehydrogenase
MAEMHSTRNVSIIGLGEMGAALARVLLAEGFSVTGWNRSPEKAERLAGQGLQIAATVLDAVIASPVVIACVSDYPTLSALLHGDEVAAAMSGKTLIQLTTRTPAEARSGEVWTNAANVACLEGSIQAYPMHIGTPEGSILYSGPRATFDAVRPILDALTGQVVHVGEQVGSAPALDLALAGTVVPGATITFLQGAAICQAEGAPLHTFLDMIESSIIPGLLLSTFRASVPMIENRDYAYSGDGAPLDAWTPGLQMTVQAARDAGINPRWNEFVLEHLERAVADGHGQGELTAIFEQLRQPAAR